MREDLGIKMYHLDMDAVSGLPHYPMKTAHSTSEMGHSAKTKEIPQRESEKYGVTKSTFEYILRRGVHW